MKCFRYLDFKSFAEVDRLILPEYYLLMESVQLRQIDRSYWTHLQAWLTFAAKAEKKAGKGKTTPVYKKFKKFFDYEQEIEKAKQGRKSKFPGVGKIFKKGV